MSISSASIRPLPDAIPGGRAALAHVLPIGRPAAGGGENERQQRPRSSIAILPRAGEGRLGATGSVEGAVTSAFSSARQHLAVPDVGIARTGPGGTGVSVSSLLMIGACRVGLAKHNMGPGWRSRHFASPARSPLPPRCADATAAQAIAMKRELRQLRQSVLLIGRIPVYVVSLGNLQANSLRPVMAVPEAVGRRTDPRIKSGDGRGGGSVRNRIALRKPGCARYETVDSARSDLRGERRLVAVGPSAPDLVDVRPSDKWNRSCRYYYPVRTFEVVLPLSQNCPRWTEPQ